MALDPVEGEDCEARQIREEPVGCMSPLFQRGGHIVEQLNGVPPEERLEAEGAAALRYDGGRTPSRQSEKLLHEGGGGEGGIERQAEDAASALLSRQCQSCVDARERARSWIVIRHAGDPESASDLPVSVRDDGFEPRLEKGGEGAAGERHAVEGRERLRAAEPATPAAREEKAEMIVRW